jgi:hypothetical protein
MIVSRGRPSVALVGSALMVVLVVASCRWSVVDALSQNKKMTRHPRMMVSSILKSFRKDDLAHNWTNEDSSSRCEENRNVVDDDDEKQLLLRMEDQYQEGLQLARQFQAFEEHAREERKQRLIDPLQARSTTLSSPSSALTPKSSAGFFGTPSTARKLFSVFSIPANKRDDGTMKKSYLPFSMTSPTSTTAIAPATARNKDELKKSKGDNFFWLTIMAATTATSNHPALLLFLLSMGVSLIFGSLLESSLSLFPMTTTTTTAATSTAVPAVMTTTSWGRLDV